MTIYIDDLNEWRPNRKSAHLGTDGPIDELHSFAKRIGLKRVWFQDKDYPHYDVFGSMYAAAIRCGAKQVTCKEWIKLVPKKQRV